jgi:hypothetical protein
VVGVEEAHQAYLFSVGPLQHRFGRSVCHATWVACSTPSRTADAGHARPARDRVFSAHEPTPGTA